MNTVIDFVRSMINKEAARLVAYGSAAAVAGALWFADAAGVELSAEILAGVSALAALLVTEAIRRFVYSADTHDADVAAAFEAGREAEVVGYV